MTYNISPILAGTAQAVITPPVGVPLLGTIQRSTGVNDELRARALVLGDGDRWIAIISLDLIGMDFEFSDSIRSAIASAGISNALVHCTHNHSAPFTIPWSILGPRSVVAHGGGWRDQLVSDIRKLASVARASAAPAVLSAGRAQVQIGFNRRLVSGTGVLMKPNPEGAVVPWVDVLRVDRSDGSTAAVLFSHAAHPVIIHGSSRLMSAEFPGFAAEKLSRLLGGNAIAIFGQAFAGNINGNPLRGGIAAARRAGEILADAAFQAANNSEPVSGTEISLKTIRTDLPLQRLPSMRECDEVLHTAERRLSDVWEAQSIDDRSLWEAQDRLAPPASQEDSCAADDTQPMEAQPWWLADTVLCLRDLREKIARGDDRPLRFEAHLLRIGDDWSLLAASHELFAEYQLLLDKTAPSRHKMMLAYTNGCESYIPRDQDLALGGYEASSFPQDGAALRYRHRRALRSGSEQQVVDTLRSLWD